jgi:hypothetical protein
MMGKYLLALSGARSDILDQCDTERLKFQSLGWAILITSVMATVSMWFALNSAIGAVGPNHLGHRPLASHLDAN